jgi:ubiquinone/menaquinone biosynthesis C-methylase UbiE
MDLKYYCQEIEKRLRENRFVSSCAVRFWKDENGKSYLAAYVVPTEKDGWTDLTGQWKHAWDMAYRKPCPSPDRTFKLYCWNSSYTLQPIPVEEMHEWANATAERILDLHPSKVLEIGCGPGLLIFLLAPRCSFYYATDFSQVALEELEQTLAEENITNVSLFHKEAKDLSQLQEIYPDVVVLNSVVQYFPSIDHLMDVLKAVIKLMPSDGKIFVGDVRSLPLLRVFHSSVAIYQASADMSAQDLQRRIKQRLAQEQELCIDPNFFYSLEQCLPQISSVDIQLKRGYSLNEMTRFRYDVILHLGEKKQARRIPWFDWKRENFTLDKLQHMLENNVYNAFGVTRIPNVRVQADVVSTKLLEQSNSFLQYDLKKIRENQKNLGIEPEEIWQISQRLSYIPSITWSRTSDDGSFDATFIKNTPWLKSEVKDILIHEFQESREQSQDLAKYANTPLVGRRNYQLLRCLRECLRDFQESLPIYLILMEKLPFLQNGLDYEALPEPNLDQTIIA